MLGQPPSACVTWSGNPRRSRASPSGPCGLSIRPSPLLVREKSGKTSMPSAARLREASTYSGRTSPPGGAGGQAGRRAVQPAAHGGLLAGKLAPGGVDGRGAGPSADISLLSRGRGKLGADPVRTLFEHVAGPAGEDGAPGMSYCGLRVIPWTGPRQTCRTARRTPGSRRPANQSRDEAFGRPGGRRRQSPGPAAGADISSGGSRRAGAPTSRTAKR